MSLLKNMITKSCRSTIEGIIISQLFIGPYAFSAETTSSSASNVQATTSVIQALGQGTQQVMASMQQAQASAAFQAELYNNNAQYLSENANYQTGYPMPDQMFGVCQVPLTYMEIPLWCETPPSDLNSYQQMAAQFDLARTNKEYYKSFTQESVNPYSNKGMKCLEERAMGLTKQLTQLRDGMAKHVESIGKIEEIFKRQATDLYNQMIDDKSVIEGGGPMSPAAEKWITDNLNDSQCKIAIDFTDNTQSGPSTQMKSKGLSGIQSYMGDSAKEAKELISSTPQLKQQFTNQLDQIRSTFQARGLDGMSTLSSTGAFSTKFAPVESLLGGQLQQFQSDFDKVKGELQQYGITIPATDSKFSTNAATELAAAPSKLKNGWYESCMQQQMAASGFNYTQVWESFFQQGVSTQQGSTVLEFKNKTKAIMDNTTYDVSKKISEINKLEAEYAAKGAPILVRLNSINQQLSSLLTTKQSDCTILYNRVDPSTNKSPSQLISEAVQSFSELKQDYEMISSDIVNDLSSRVLSCSHEPSFTATKTACEERMNISSEKFCFKNSVDKCATPINGCYNKVASLITQKKAERGAKAKKFNEAFDRLLVDRDIALERMKATYATVDAQLKMLVKETKNSQLQNMDLGLGDLTVKPPVKALDSSTGEMLMAGEGGDWQSWFTDNAISKKWDPTIKGKLDEQIKRISTILEAEKKRLSTEYDKMGKAWDGLEKKCDGILDEYAANSRKQFQDQQACEAAKQGFCRKAASAFGPGCGDVAESLSSDLTMIMGKSGNGSMACASPETEVWVSNFSAYCSQVYGQSDESDPPSAFGYSEDDEITADDINRLCKDNGKKMRADSVSALKTILAKDTSIKEADIISFVDGGDNSKKVLSALQEVYGNSTDVYKYYQWLNEFGSNSKIQAACEKDFISVSWQDEDKDKGISKPITTCKGKPLRNKDGIVTDYDKQHCDEAEKVANFNKKQEELLQNYSSYANLLTKAVKNGGASSFNMGEFGMPGDCGTVSTSFWDFNLGENLIEDDTGIGALNN